MKFLTGFLVLLFVVSLISARSIPRRRDNDEFTPVLDQVSISTNNVYSWSEGSTQYHQYEVVIYNNSPEILLSVHIDIKNPNGLKLRNDGSLWNAEWVKASPYNQFIVNDSIYKYNEYKFTFIVEGEVYPILDLGSVRY